MEPRLALSRFPRRRGRLAARAGTAPAVRRFLVIGLGAAGAIAADQPLRRRPRRAAVAIAARRTRPLAARVRGRSIRKSAGPSRTSRRTSATPSSRLRPEHASTRASIRSPVSATTARSRKSWHARWPTPSRQDRPLSLAIIDLDDLKRLNDTEGHAAGDQLLADVGRLIRATIRAVRPLRSGSAATSSPLLLPGTDGERRTASSGACWPAPPAATRPCATHRASRSRRDLHVPAPSPDAVRLTHHADAALYWAQAPRPDRHPGLRPSPPRAADDERSAEELAEAVARVASTRAPRPVYQPIISLVTGHPVGFEGLVRPTPDSGLPDARACSRQPRSPTGSSSSTWPRSRRSPPGRAARAGPLPEPQPVAADPRDRAVPRRRADRDPAPHGAGAGPGRHRADRARGHRGPVPPEARTWSGSGPPASASPPTTSGPATPGSGC